MTRGEELRLIIDDAAFEGKTVSRVNGLVVFVEGAVPGDVVTARITKVKKSFVEARVLNVAEPSRLRVTPRCRYFGTCGGCQWQHVDYRAQLQFKQQHVVDAFERIGGFSSLDLLPIIGADNSSVESGYTSGTYFYRNKMEFSFSRQQWLAEKPETRDRSVDIPGQGLKRETYLGLHVPQRYDKVLDIEECHLQSPVSVEILNFTRSFARDTGLPVYNSKTESGYWRFLVIRQSRRTAELMVNVVTFDERPDTMTRYTHALLKILPEITTVVNTINSKKAQIAYGERERAYHGGGIIHEHIGGRTFAISAGSFFQTNTDQAEKLYSVAKEFGGFSRSDVVWDLYSGTGTIALYVSDAVKEVVGIESAESAVKDAQRNAELNKVTNCSFILGDLKERLTKDTRWMSAHPTPDVMIIDPPRSGMHPNVVAEILEIMPSRIVYVSCNPATQARDAKQLCAEKYRLKKLQPVDMFPHTYHVENVVLLDRL